MSEHIYSGRTTPTPVRYENDEILVDGKQPAVWWHVICSSRTPHEAMISGCRESLVAGLGNLIEPGGERDLYDSELWVMGPRDGGQPFVTIEKRLAPTYRHSDLLGQQSAVLSAKGHSIIVVPTDRWLCFAAGIDWMVGYSLMAEGGSVWWGSHVDTTLAIGVSSATTGTGLELRPGAWTPVYPGNPVLHCRAISSQAKLHMRKFCRDRVFGPGPV